MSKAARAVAVLGLVAWAALPSACGQKGPPLAPLRLVPAAVKEISLRRVGDRARLRFVLPTQNANGPGPLQLDRVEIYAMTVPAGVPAPPNRELLTKAYLVGQVAVRPAPEDGKPPKEGETRPEPGETVIFDEELTPAKLTPVTRVVPRTEPPRAAARGSSSPSP